MATTPAGLSSRNPFTGHVAEGNCVRVPFGGLLQLVLVIYDDCADEVAGVIPEATQEDDRPAAQEDFRECHLTSLGWPAERI